MISSELYLNMSITQVSSTFSHNNQVYKATATEVNLELSMTTVADTQAFLSQKNVDKINAMLEEYGMPSLQESYADGIDVSPEATATRILNFATGGFAAYNARHDDTSHDVNVDNFMDLIGGAIEKGFEEAREILDALDVLNGEILENVDKTYDLVQEGLLQFKENILDFNQPAIAS